MNAEQEKLLFEARESYAAAEQLYELVNENQKRAYLINEEKGELLKEVGKLLERCGEYDTNRDWQLQQADSRTREAKKLERQGRRLQRKARWVGRFG